MRKLLAMLIALAMLLQMTGPVFAEAEPAEVQEAVAELAADAGLIEQEEAPVVVAEAPAEPEPQPAADEPAPAAEESVTVEEEAPEAPAEEAAPAEETPAAPETPAAAEEEEELHIDPQPETPVAEETEEVVEEPAADEAPTVIPFIAMVSVKAEQDAVNEGENVVLTAKVDTGVAYTVIWEAHDPATDVEGEEVVWTKVAEGESYTFVADPAKAAVEYRAVALPVEGEGRAVSAAVTVAVIPAETEATETEAVEDAPKADAEEVTEEDKAEETKEEDPKAEDAEKPADEEEETSTEIVIDLNGGDEEKADEAEDAEQAETNDEESSEEELLEEEVVEEEIEVEGAEEAYGEKTLAVNASPTSDTLTPAKQSQIWKVTTTTVGSLNVYADPVSYSGFTLDLTLWNEDMSVPISNAIGNTRVTVGYSWLDAGTYYVEVKSTDAAASAVGYTIEARQNAAGIMMSNNRSQLNAYSVTNGTTITGAFTWQSGENKLGTIYDYAQFTLDSTSRVTVQVNDYTGDQIHVELYNGTITEQLNGALDFEAAAGSESATTSTTKEVYLESGTYFLRLLPTDKKGQSKQIGKYELIVRWSSCETTEVEPNNGIGNPTPIAYGQTHRGAITLTDRRDIYRITTGAGYAQEVDITINDGFGINVTIWDVNQSTAYFTTNDPNMSGYYYRDPLNNTAESPAGFDMTLLGTGTESNKVQGKFHAKLNPSTAYYIVIDPVSAVPAGNKWNSSPAFTGVYDITVTADKTVQSMVAAVYDNWAVATGGVSDMYQAVARFTAPGAEYDNGVWDVFHNGTQLTPEVDYKIIGISTTSGQNGWYYDKYLNGCPNQTTLHANDVWSAIVVQFVPSNTFVINNGDQFIFRFRTIDLTGLNKGRWHSHTSGAVTIGNGTTVKQVNMPVNAINNGTQFTVTADLTPDSITTRTYLWWIVDAATGKTVETQVTTVPAATFTAKYVGTYFCQMFWWDPNALNPITNQVTGYWEYNANHDSRYNPYISRQTLTINSGMAITSVQLTKKNDLVLHVVMTTTTNPTYTNYVVYLDGVKQTDSYYFTNGTKEFDIPISNPGTYMVYGQAWDGASNAWVTVPSNTVTIAPDNHLSALTASATSVSIGDNVAFTMSYSGTLIATQYQLYYYATVPGTPQLVATWSGNSPVHVFNLTKEGSYVVVASAAFNNGKTEMKTSDVIEVKNNAPYVVDAQGKQVAPGVTSAITISNATPTKGTPVNISIKTGGSTPTSIKWELYKHDGTLVYTDVNNKKSFLFNTATLDEKYLDINSVTGKVTSTDFYVKVSLSSDAAAPYTYTTWQSNNITVTLKDAPDPSF